MKVFTYSEARQNLSRLLTIAKNEEVEIRRRDGSIFSLVSKRAESKSPFDVQGIKTKAKTQDILDAVRDSRSRPSGFALVARLRRGHWSYVVGQDLGDVRRRTTVMPAFKLVIPAQVGIHKN